MPKYKIPVTWSVYGVMEVEAPTLEKARLKAIDECPLPTDGEYIDDSCKVDEYSPLYGEKV